MATFQGENYYESNFCRLLGWSVIILKVGIIHVTMITYCPYSKIKMVLFENVGQTSGAVVLFLSLRLMVCLRKGVFKCLRIIKLS